jgi:outer membrane receptor for ferrienterochelin and colicins
LPKIVDGEPNNSLHEDYYGSWFGGEARVVITPVKILRLTVGGEVQGHPFTRLYGTEVEDDLKTPVPDGTYVDEKHGFVLGAPYAVVDFTPVKWFKVDAGIRIDIYSSFGAIAVPRGALIFKPTEGGTLKVMAGRAFRAPSIYEQFYNDGGFSQAKATDPTRNLSLGPESVVSSEVEYSQRFLKDWVGLGAFNVSYIESIINSVQDMPDSDVVRYANSDVPALSLGGEVELRREWRNGWMVSGFYGYQRAQYLSSSDPALKDNPRLINYPEHNAGVKAVFPIIPDFVSLGVRGTFEGPRRIDLQTDDLTDPAVVADVALSGYAPKYGLRYVVGIYNLFDWTYAVPVSETYASRTMPQNGRTFLADVEISYP